MLCISIVVNPILHNVTGRDNMSTHRLITLFLCLASTSCTLAAGNPNTTNKELRDRIHPGMTRAEVSEIMGKPVVEIGRQGKPDVLAYGYAEMKWAPWPLARSEEPAFLLSGLEVSFSPKGTVNGVGTCKVCNPPECK